jgi:adenylylsulfate kinase
VLCEISLIKETPFVHKLYKGSAGEFRYTMAQEEPSKKTDNIVFHHHQITKGDRQKRNGNKSFVLWFTGLSGSGKSTLASHTEEALFNLGLHTYILDGDNVRHGLNKNLGFSQEDRSENIRRIGEVSKLLVDSGTIVLTAFISPYSVDREMVRKMLDDHEFIEVFVNCPLSVCETRDTKGLYKKARAGEIKHFTGIDDPYEEPSNPELNIDTDTLTIKQSAIKIVTYLQEKKLI